MTESNTTFNNYSDGKALITHIWIKWFHTTKQLLDIKQKCFFHCTVWIISALTHARSDHFSYFNKSLHESYKSVLINDTNEPEMIWEMFAGVRSDRQHAKQLWFVIIIMNHAHNPHTDYR